MKQVVAEKVPESSFTISFVAPDVCYSALWFPLPIELERIDELIAAVESE